MQGTRAQPLLPSGAAMCHSCLSDGVFMGADGCQGNRGFGESGAAGSRCWLTPGAAHAGAAGDSVPAARSPLSAWSFSILVSPRRGSSAAGLKAPSKGQRANPSSTGTAASGTFYLASGVWTMKGKGTIRGGCGREKEDIDFSQLLLRSCLSHSERGLHL